MIPFTQLSRQKQIDDALSEAELPDGIAIRAWLETDFPVIQQLSLAEGWPTPTQRPEHSLISWRNAWPALVAVDMQTGSVIGFARGLTDGEVTTFIAELLVALEHRGCGVGQALLDACYHLYPHTRIELLSMETSEGFYESHGFRRVGQGFRRSYL